MGKKKEKSVPTGNTRVTEQLQAEVHALQKTIETLAFRILFSRDILVGAGDEIERRGRMTPKIAHDLSLQIETMDNILSQIFGLSEGGAQRFRKGYDGTAFAKGVEETANLISPLIVSPSGLRKSGKFTLN